MAEKEYIERDSVLRSLAVLLQMPFTDLDDAWEAVHKTPAADVVEVVRCKDCQHYIDGHCYVKNRKPFSYDVNIHSCKENDFCSYGERKEATP
jgi:hypothetical protein